MEYAYVGGVRSLPIKGQIGICAGCGTKMIAKCGQINIHHWAHSSKIECDPWWESETEWHRDWKDQFPERYREVVLFDDQTGEFHRADVHTDTGVTIEFQNSPLSLAELQSRERFYKKLIWVLNGKKFKGFQIANAIPNPTHPGFNGFEILGDLIPTYFATDERFWPKRLKTIHSLRAPHLQKIKMSPWHDSFKWSHAHKVWLNATSPVFVDMGGHFLYWIKRKQQLSGDFLYLKKVVRKEFVSRYSEEQQVNIGQE